MNDNEAQLQDLGIELVSQSALENEIETNAQSLINKQTLEQEHNRLERAENALQKLTTRREVLKRKKAAATRISVRSKLQEQIDELEENELQTLRKDVLDVKKRIREIAKSNNAVGGADTSGRQAGESEKDYLIRTGKITAFGTETEFKVDDGSDTYEPFPDKGPKSDEDDDFQDEEDGLGSASSDRDYDSSTEEHYHKEPVFVDDGDEWNYQMRIKKWIKERSSLRRNDRNPDLEEYLKPHPNIPDAKLNDDFKIPGDIFRLLFNYQKTCVQWLYELFQQQCGGIIGDEMGLGKTIQIIAFLASLHHSGKLDGPVLIVCPATVLRQWCKEFHTWWPPFRTVILHSIGAGMTQKDTISEEKLA